MRDERRGKGERRRGDRRAIGGRRRHDRNAALLERAGRVVGLLAIMLLVIVLAVLTVRSRAAANDARDAAIDAKAALKATDTVLSSLRQSQVEACGRGNIVRAESNARVPSQVVLVDVLRDFLQSAQTARARQPGYGDIAKEYRAFRIRLRTVQFKAVPLIDCAIAVPPVGTLTPKPQGHG